MEEGDLRSKCKMIATLIIYFVGVLFTIRPFLYFYGMLTRYIVIKYDVVSESVYSAVRSEYTTILMVILFVLAELFSFTLLMKALAKRNGLRYIVILLSILVVVFVAAPVSMAVDVGLDPMTGDLSCALGKYSVRIGSGEVVMKTNANHLKIVLNTKCHSLRPYEVFNMNDISFVGFRDDGIDIYFKDSARQRLLQAKSIYDYDTVKVIIDGRCVREIPFSEFAQSPYRYVVFRSADFNEINDFYKNMIYDKFIIAVQQMAIRFVFD